MADLRRLDPATACGLITERGGVALARTYEHGWERDIALRSAVLTAIRDAAEGAQPATSRIRPPPLAGDGGA